MCKRSINCRLRDIPRWQLPHMAPCLGVPNAVLRVSASCTLPCHLATQKPGVVLFGTQSHRAPHLTVCCRCAPGGPEAAQKVGCLGVLVAVEDVQALAPHQRRQLAHRRLPSPRLAHQQHRLRVLQTPARACAHRQTHRNGQSRKRILNARQPGCLRAGSAPFTGDASMKAHSQRKQGRPWGAGQWGSSV
jgi:hypothetical protein